MSKVSIAVVTDLHFAPPGTAVTSARRYDLAEQLLRGALETLNTRIRPDVIVVPGDLLEDGRAVVAPVLYRQIASILATSRSPVVVLPGNHDGPAFFEVFPQPTIQEYAGVRFVLHVDPPAPVLNAIRPPEGLELMAAARAGHTGPIVALQHVPIFPPGAAFCPYGYVNADEVVEAMRRHRIHLAVAGHFHAGFNLVRDDGLWFHTTRALAEAPHCFDVLRTDGEVVEVEHYTLD